MKIADTLRDALRGPGAGWRIAGAAVLTATVAAQHPNDLFDRIRTRDAVYLIPNWRFFAPNPAVHDSNLLYRTLSSDDDTSPWTEISLAPDRTVRHMIWFPDRRAGKAIFDAGDEILRYINRGFSVAQRLPSYRLLENYLRREIRESEGGHAIKGFQFAFARTAGYDTKEEAEMLFISPYTPMVPPTRPTPAA
ncbi:hypothetical protein ABTZ59_25465 [Streptomyces sp. NPDC094034]|uniref:hypothetical protein n=1 Tax=Streptomyces sp. NPDC094034 TaxID=3155309 RepID=UPI003329571F